MRTFRRRNNPKGYGLIDAFVGIVLLAIVAVSFSYAFQSLTTLTDRQIERLEKLLNDSDASVLEKAYS